MCVQFPVWACLGVWVCMQSYRVSPRAFVLIQCLHGAVYSQFGEFGLLSTWFIFLLMSPTFLRTDLDLTSSEEQFAFPSPLNLVFLIFQKNSGAWRAERTGFREEQSELRLLMGRSCSIANQATYGQQEERVYDSFALGVLQKLTAGTLDSPSLFQDLRFSCFPALNNIGCLWEWKMSAWPCFSCVAAPALMHFQHLSWNLLESTSSPWKHSSLCVDQGNVHWGWFSLCVAPLVLMVERSRQALFCLWACRRVHIAHQSRTDMSYHWIKQVYELQTWLPHCLANFLYLPVFAEPVGTLCPSIIFPSVRLGWNWKSDWKISRETQTRIP